MRGFSVLPWGLCAALSALPACNCEGANFNKAEAHAAAPTALDLGNVAVGQSNVATLYVSNDGSDLLKLGVVELSGPAAAAFAVSRASDAVNPGASTTVTVTFAPTQEGTATATLSLSSNAVDHPVLEVALTGTGDPPAVTVQPLALDFGQVLPGQFATLPLTLTNRTSQEVTVALRVEDDGTQAYSVEGAALGSAANVAVPGNGQVVQAVRFSPNQGGRATGSLRVESCGPGCGQAVSLTGVMAAPRLDVTPVVVDFGRVESGQTASGSVTLSNRGSMTLTVTGALLGNPGAAFSVLDAAVVPLTLAPAEETVLHLTYTAVHPGHSQDQLTLQSNDPRTPEAVVQLVGATSGSDVVLLPGAVNFGPVRDSAQVTQDVLILNRGDVAATLHGLAVDGLGYSLDPEGQPPFPYPLGPAASLLMMVRFEAANLGTYLGHFTVDADNNGPSVLTAALEAQRVDVSCGVQPSTPEVNLGLVRLGQQSQVSFTVRNVGPGNCTLTPPVPAPGYASDAAFSFTGMGGLFTPGELRNVYVRYAPHVAGNNRAVVQVGVLGQAPVLVTTRGKGSAGGVSVNPAYLDFGGIPLHCGAVSRSLTVVNDGAIPLQLDVPTASPAPEYTLAGGGLSRSLVPGAAGSLSVTFSPQQLGVVSGQVRVVAHVPDEEELLVGLRGEGVDTQTPVTEHFTVESTNQMDVVFVVDNSGSMADNQTNLSTNAAAFINAAGTVDYQIGVTTTDVTPEGAHGLFVGTPPIIKRNTGNPTAQFTAQVLRGTNGSGWEQGLEAARLALSNATVNAGFIRDTAGLAVVVLSDEDDQSPLTVQQYVDFFLGLKAVSGAPVLVNAISGGDLGCATGAPAPRYVEAVARTGGVAVSICDPDWGTKMRQVGEAALAARGRFRLAGHPVATSLAVVVNGVTLPAIAWTFDPVSNTVILNPSRIPAPGSSVNITYVPQC